MKESTQQHKEQEEIRMRMEYHQGDKNDLAEELSFSSGGESDHSQHPPDFYEAIFDSDYPPKQHFRKSSLKLMTPKEKHLSP